VAKWLGTPDVPLVGRVAEQEALRALLLPPSGRPEFVGLEGEPGTGKTRLLSELPYVPGDQSAAVLRVGGDTAVGGLCQALADALGIAWRGREHRSEGQAWAAVRNALRDCRGDRLFILVIDDAHLMDAGSVQLMLDLLDRPPGASLRLAMGYRPRQTPPQLLAALSRLRSPWRVTRLSLGPLSQDEASSLLATDVCGRHRSMAYTLCDGNPRYLEVLVRSCAGASECHGHSLRDCLDDFPVTSIVPLFAEIRAVSELGHRVASAASVIGSEFDVGTLGAIAELAQRAVLDGIDELLAKDIIRNSNDPGTFRFRHPLVADIVYLSIPGGQRLAMHGRAAEALRAAGGPVTAYARHLERLGRAAGKTSVPILAEAAHAQEASAPATASRLYRGALDMLGRDPRDCRLRATLLAGLARSLGLEGRLTACRDALDERAQLLRATDWQDEIPELTEWRAMLAQSDGRYEDARRILLDAVNATRGGVHDDWWARAASLRITLASTVLWEPLADQAHEWAEGALRAAAPTNDSLLRAHALALCAPVLLATDDKESASESARAAAVLADPCPDARLISRLAVLPSLAWAELLLEQHAAAIAHFGRGLSLGKMTGQQPLAVHALLGLGSVCMQRGLVSEAAAHAAEAERLSQLTDSAELHAMALVLHTEAALASGALNELSEAFQAVLNTLGPGTAWGRRACLVLAAARLTGGDTAGCEQAIANADQAGACGSRDRIQSADLLARAALARGDRVAAKLWAKRAKEAAQRAGLPGLCAMAALIAAEAEDDHELAAARAQDAATAARAADFMLTECRAHLVAKDALTALGRTEAAAKHAAASDEIAVRTGAAPSRLVLAGDGAGSKPEDVHMLSKREFEIARLVGRGFTNRQIARRLAISHKTVETHLARIFARLNVSSRAEIAHMVGSSKVIARPREGRPEDFGSG
jgi:DNA-binding CsgD family transcriptional regulator